MGESPNSNAADRPVIIVEPNPTGHRLSYVRLIAAEALEQGQRVVLSTSEGATSAPEYELHLAGISARIGVVTTPTDPTSIEALARGLNAALTVVPDGDLFAIELAKRGFWRGGKLAVLIMRESAQPKRIPGTVRVRSWIKRTLVRRASKLNGVRILTLQSATSSRLDPKATVADPVVLQCTQVDIAGARGMLSDHADTYWFGVMGAVTSRKNLPLVAESLSKIEKGSVGLLIAGTISSSVFEESLPWLEAMKARGHPVMVIDRILSDPELDALVTALDCIVLAHSNEGPSGLLGKAVASGTRVVAAGARSLRRDVAIIGAGASWVPLRRSSLTGAFQEAAGKSRPSPKILSAPTEFAKAFLCF
ncbi:hypothetical protein IWX78_000025 [Mycetocola sp. CAN_C7]|uniref:hypothetical protein n=1 Tax=Mycetocola sp. CAN_C7 TaxID=2787724 RepID=UPI0018C8E3E4